MKIKGSEIKIVAQLFLILLLILPVIGCSQNSVSSYEGRRDKVSEAHAALRELYKTSPAARALSEKAVGILIFPDIVKGGLIVGGQFGEGVLLKGRQVGGFYSSVSGSYGLQAGLQKFGYASFFMSEKDLDYLNKSDGWEIGVGPTITILDEGKSKSFTTTTARDGVYAFFFQQTGLMAGIGIQGTKISRIDK